MPGDIKRTDLTRFYQEVGERYPEEEIVYRDLRGRLRKQFILTTLVQNASGKFLDLGCNVGVYLEHFHSEQAVGVDIAVAALAHARHRCQSLPQATRFYFIAGNVENLDFLRDIQFDSILCSEVLEHLFHPEKVLVAIARLLKPGGIALITTPNYKKQKPTWVPLGELKSSVSGDQYFHTAFRPEELSAMAIAARLHVLTAGTLEWQVKYAAKIPALFFLLLRWLNRHSFASDRFEHLNQRLFEVFTLACYYFAHYTSIEKLLRPWIRAGVRSYVLLTRPLDSQ